MKKMIIARASDHQFEVEHPKDALQIVGKGQAVRLDRVIARERKAAAATKMYALSSRTESRCIGRPWR
jgi:hypothetical protein